MRQEEGSMAGWLSWLGFAAAPAVASDAMVDLSTMTLTRLDGTRMPAAELVGKAVLFVNVASKCGYTPQYEGLQDLYEARKDGGLVIVGVPCNQFGGQEPGGKEEIASFCKLNYGVTFPLLEKQDVNGAGRSPLYSALIGSGPDIRWNFEKILVDRTGKVTGRFGSRVQPGSPELASAIDAALR
jgi:glutathione peroxidase-family protein